MKSGGLFVGVMLSATLLGCGGQAGLGPDSAQAPGELTITSASAARQRAQSRRVVRISVKSHHQVQTLADRGLDLFENVNLRAGYVDATVTPSDETYLESQGYSYRVLPGAKPALSAYGLEAGYHTVASLQKDFEALAQSHPKIARYSVIGKSLNGQDLFMLEICSKPGTGLPQILFDSGQHARELPPVEINFQLASKLVNGYGGNTDLTRLIDTRDVFIVPMVNPDGRTDVEQGDTYWRKNLRQNSDGSQGVDTNRNSDDHWSEGDTNGSAEDFRGASPTSEPETKALRDLVSSHKFTTSVDIHNFAGMVLYPPGFDESNTKDEDTFSKIGHHLADSIGYQSGTIAQSLYRTYGDFSTWQYERFGMIAFGIELDDSGFAAPFSEATRDWQAWQDKLVWLVSIADDPRAEAQHIQVTPTFDVGI